MRKRINLLLLTGIVAVILYYSIIPVPGVQYGNELLDPAQLYHAAAYFALAGALMLHFHDTPRGHHEAIMVAALFGLCMESIQLFLPERTFSPVDIWVNIFGASIILLDHRSQLVTKIIRAEDRLITRILEL